jgi:hypothetical protein
MLCLYYLLYIIYIIYILKESLDFFYLPNASSHTISLGLTQSITEINTGNLPGR